MIVQQRDRTTLAMGTGALFSGAALIVCILSGVSLRITLALAAASVILVIRLIWRASSPDVRRRLIVSVRAGLLSGILATLAYDVSRLELSQWDSSPYNPFEAVRMFGILLAGPTFPDALVYATGAAFHAVNGVSFAIAYCFLFKVPGVATGIAWAILLEGLQLALYPGWLGIRFYREFVSISAGSHLIYGATLGLCARHVLIQRRV